MKVISIIPARMAASRFPGKPLVKILGTPMIEHIWRRAMMSKKFSEVYVATCDQEIFDHIEALGGNAVMTANTHERCTDRTAEALEKIEKEKKETYDIVAMVQGDEPLVDPLVFDQAIEKFADHTVGIVNLMGEITSKKELESPHIVKVVTNLKDEALYFSRQPIPTIREGISTDWRRQTGLIFFTRDALLKFNALAPTSLEKSESVDMMRVLEHGDRIQMLFSSMPCLTIDIPEDLPPVEYVMREDATYQKYKD